MRPRCCSLSIAVSTTTSLLYLKPKRLLAHPIVVTCSYPIAILMPLPEHYRTRRNSGKRDSPTVNAADKFDSLDSSKSDEESHQPSHNSRKDPNIIERIRRVSLSSSQKSAASRRFSEHSGPMTAPSPDSPIAGSSYIRHQTLKRVQIESSTSEFEHDVEEQKRQRERLAQLNQQQRLSERGVTPHSPSKCDRCIVGSPTLLVSVVIFFLFAGAGIAVGMVIGESKESALQEEAHALAIETGQYFSEQLDRAILPLFSMAQFATHVNMFESLPRRIGEAGEPGSLPLNNETWKRDISGVCDDPTLMNTFVEIATNIKRASGMDGILANIQLSPHGVICLLHPMNNTEDFDEGQFLDSTPAWGLDLVHDPFMKYIALKSLTQEEVGIAGPRRLTQCPDCYPFLIARLPIVYSGHQIYVDGVPYDRWGFATALIAWTSLVEQSGMYETFDENEFEFQLTRTDRNLNTETQEYESEVVILAETPNFKRLDKWRYVFTSLDTTNNEWVMTVAYDPTPVARTKGLIIGSCVVVALFIALLIYIVLSQKHEHADILAESSAQEAKVATERNITSYFAHELRNPLSAMDSALNSITTEDLPPTTKELFDAMQLCSSFMSSIMNNLLDVRKIEEGKMRIRSYPLSLRILVDNSHKMMKSLARPGVEFLVVKRIPAGRNWVLGDEPRIQQVLTNVVTNAIKYTSQGSITLAVSWQDHFVQIECIDTGPGIPRSEQKRMFERFVQRGGAPGTGLGLNIAQQIVNMMQGRIWFESDPTVKPGTTCRILLPLALCEDQGEEQHPKETSGVTTGPRPMITEALKVLILDDIKMNRTMLSRRIQKAIAPNAIITMAQTGEEALKICEKSPNEFDIIICDQYMEEAGGVMVGTDAIIAMRRMKVTAFIIGCSGNDLDAEFYDAGADMVWGKPLPSNMEIVDQWRDGLLARQVERTSKRRLSSSDSSR